LWSGATRVGSFLMYTAGGTGCRVDVLVNNAGQGLTYPCAEVPLSKAKATFDVNVWGALELTQVSHRVLAQSLSGA
jgi:short-subunit dehydrogenase